MKMRATGLTFLLLTAPLAVPGQAELLQSGPMVGCSEMREVELWAQTNAEATVWIEYWTAADPATRNATNKVTTAKEAAFTAHLTADEVEPGTAYNYELFINGKAVARPYPLEFQTQKLWQWREDPPNFKIALGSCLFVNETEYDRPGEPYGGEYEILTTLVGKDPDAMVWLGDNVYLREVDWFSRSGILKRYTHTRSLPELQPLLASIHNYAMWDDHDFGPDNSDRGFRNKETSLEAFKLFWANSTYGVEGEPGTASMFQWGDAEFYLLDDRYHRAPDRRSTGERTMLGDTQFEWLIDNLATSTAPFKIIALGGAVLNPSLRGEKWGALYPAERDKLLRTIEQEGIPGVLFVSGDLHITELTMLKRYGTYPLYDVTISPLTSGTRSDDIDPANTLRVPDTFVGERNFAIFEFTGPRKDRVLTIHIYDVKGTEKWSREIRETELK